MSAVIVTWPALVGLAALAVVTGFGSGMLVMWDLARPERDAEHKGPHTFAVHFMGACLPGCPWCWVERQYPEHGRTVPFLAGREIVMPSGPPADLTVPFLAVPQPEREHPFDLG